MLKKTDYLFIIMSFFAITFLYILFSRNVSVNTNNTLLKSIDLPWDYSIEKEYESDTAEYVILCGDRRDSDITGNMIRILSELKLEYSVCDRIEALPVPRTDSAGVIIVTAGSWDEIGNVDLLAHYVDASGTRVILTDIMDNDAKDHNALVGVVDTGRYEDIEGIILCEELFIQGMLYYENMKLNAREVTLDGRCKKIATEWTRDKEQKELIPLIWQRNVGNGAYYVVNGNVLDEGSSYGIVTGLLSMINGDFVYPVVNAKLCILDSFPELDNEYDEEINSLYSRNTTVFIRDIVLPSFVKITEADNLSFSAVNRKPVPESLSEQYQYISKIMQKWNCDIYDESVLDETDLLLICSGHYRSSNNTFNMQSRISGAAMATHYIDMSEIMGKNSGDADYEWSKYSLELSKTIYELFYDTEWIDSVSLSQAWERYKRYILVRPDIEYQEDMIYIDTGNFNDVCYYILRTDGKVVSGEGYEASLIGENAYLIRVNMPSVSISVKH